MVFKGDTGTYLRYTAEENISDATTLRLYYRKPSGVTGAWTAALYGTSGVQYQTETGDLDEAGTWKLQPYIETPIWQGYGEPVTLEVYPTLV